MSNPKLKAALGWVGVFSQSLLDFAAKALLFLCLIVGASYLSKEVFGWGSPSPKDAPLQMIILEDAVLVNCRVVDRSQPSCTMLSECTDGVDRCVITFEILRREPGPADALPMETSD